MTRIAIIGTGRMARGLAAGWARAGHEVRLGSRSPQDRANLAGEIGVDAGVFAVDAALEGAEIAILAIPFRSVETFAKTHAARLRPLPVVDISNPFDALPDNRIAGAEITARAIGEGARVMAAFKDNFANTLLHPAGESGVRRDVHCAGDDEDDKRLLAGLIEDLGFQSVDCGPLRAARILDGMVPLMIDLDRRHAGGRGSTSWKFLR